MRLPVPVSRLHLRGLSDEFFAHVRSAGLRTVAYPPDDEPEVWYRRNAPFDHRYDVVASHAKRGFFRRIQEGRPTRAVYVPWGFNPRFFDRPAQMPAPTHDVVFVGRNARCTNTTRRCSAKTANAVTRRCEQLPDCAISMAGGSRSSATAGTDIATSRGMRAGAVASKTWCAPSSSRASCSILVDG